MKKFLTKSQERGAADFGWLKTHYSFSFANYYHPDYLQFGALRVLNDDEVAPHSGFPTHPHQNMEIITIPLEGVLRHQDSTGSVGELQAGDIQVMSAGTGIQHSEMNPSKDTTLKLLQIWVFPDQNGLTPRYKDVKLDQKAMENKFSTIIEPNAGDGALAISQKAYFHLGKFDADTNFEYELHGKGQGLFTFVIEGGVKVEDERLERRDSLGLWDTEKVSMEINKDSYVLLIEVPMEP